VTQVALDARRLQDVPHTGVGRRLANLVPRLRDEVDLVLLTDATRPSLDLGCEEVPLRAVRGLTEVAWLQGSVARWLRSFDGIFHGTYNAIPFVTKTPCVVTIHDLSWEHHPEDYSRLRQQAWRTQARWSARHAKAVVTVSEHARDEVRAAYGVPDARLVVAPPAPDPVFSPERAADAPGVVATLGIDGPYVLALDGAPRRGAEVALAAWRRLPAPRPSLLVVGSSGPAEDGVVRAGPLDDAAWSAVIAGALAFCYPTRYEGYGMPALEAAASGTPVVCASVGPLPEVLGSAAEWCASTSVDDIAIGLARVVSDEARAAALSRAGLEQAQRAPSWDACARAVLSAYALAAT
jgi:alpha-1,3-rhamnosyl/mannosyltransferase